MLCKMIKVRIVIQSSLEQGRILENHGLLKARCERGFILTVGFDSIKNQSVIFACRSPRELPALPKAACPWWLLAPTGSFSFTFVGLYQVFCTVEQSRFVLMLWGNDLLLVKALKHMAGRLLTMLLS